MSTRLRDALDGLEKAAAEAFSDAVLPSPQWNRLAIALQLAREALAADLVAPKTERKLVPIYQVRKLFQPARTFAPSMPEQWSRWYEVSEARYKTLTNTKLSKYEGRTMWLEVT